MNNANLQIIENLKESVRQENRHLAQTLRLLMQVADRRIHLAQGYSSLYEFCVLELGLSEGTVYRRTQVVAKIRKYPTLLTMIEDSRINLTVAALLCPHLDSQSNVDVFLSKFVGKTKRVAEGMLVDKLKPRPTPRDDIRRLPDREIPIGTVGQEVPAGNLAGMGTGNPSAKPGDPSSAKETAGGQSPAESERRPVIIRERCYQFNFAASERLKQKLERLQGMLAHKYPSGRLEHLIEEAVDHLLAARTPKAKRETSPKTSSSRHIPIKWKEQIYLRSGHRCEFIGESGRRCHATRLLQIDHRRPLSLGGKTDLANLQLVCSMHNLHKAKCDHDAEFIERKISGL